MDKTPNKSQSSLLGIFINILLPVLILDYCSAGPANPLERPEGESFWHIGPVWSLVIALSLPLVYGIRSLAVSRKFDLMSVVGMAGVLQNVEDRTDTWKGYIRVEKAERHYFLIDGDDVMTLQWRESSMRKPIRRVPR